MNIERARQTADGRWNWTSFRDGVAYPVPPCVLPDGRSCDHPTQEDAERHYWDWEHTTAHVSPIPVPLCEFQSCDAVATTRITYPCGRVDEVCDEHATPEARRVLHGFIPDTRIVWS